MALLRDRAGVEDIEIQLEEPDWDSLGSGHLERIDDTNLVKRVREGRVPGHMKSGRPKKSLDEMVKDDMKKRGLCINDAQDRNKWKRCCRRVVDPG